METLELLEERLMEYQGTLLLVSHDREFLDNVVTHLWVFEGEGKIDEQVGGYSDWQERLQAQNARQAVPQPANKSTAKPASATPAAEPKSPAKKLSYKLQRELDALPDQIAEVEAQRDALAEQSNAPDFYAGDQETVQNVLAQQAALEEKLEALEERWMELEDMAS